MKNIKAKIERVEKETRRIAAIDKLITYCEAQHLKPVATFINGDQVGRADDSVIIDKNIMIQMLAEQKLTIELEIESDVKFITAIELLVSSKVSPEPDMPKPAMQSPAPMPPPVAMPPVFR